MKPLWGLAGLALLGTAGVAGAVIVASSGGEEEIVQQVETGAPASSVDACDPKATPPPGTKLWRWLDVTVILPDDPGFLAFPETIPPDIKPPDGGFGLNIRQFDPSDSGIWSSVLIDAENGDVVREDIRAEHRTSMEESKSTITLCAFDSANAPWPYNGDPPANATREIGHGLSFVRPDPGTGLFIDFWVGSGAGAGDATRGDCEAVFEGLGLRNGRSSAGIGIDSRTGSLCKNLSQVLPEDMAVFERFFAEIRQCERDIHC